MCADFDWKCPFLCPKSAIMDFFFKILAKMQYDLSPRSSQRQNLEVFMNSHQEIRRKPWNWLRKCRFFGPKSAIMDFFRLVFSNSNFTTERTKWDQNQVNVTLSSGVMAQNAWNSEKCHFFYQFWCSLYNSANFKIYASKLKIETLYLLCL